MSEGARLSSSQVDAVEADWAAFVGSAAPCPIDDETDLRSLLYTYDEPVQSEDGTCARQKTYVPFDLSHRVLGFDAAALTRAALLALPHTRRLRVLQTIVGRLHELGMDWVGIYRRVCVDGKYVLAKEAYRGAKSRALFPLTAEFAERSNNAWVGRTGQVRLISDLASYSGPYYECDGRVQSELCAPIFARGSSGPVVGIIDAESFAAEFFDPARTAAILAVCAALGPVLVPDSAVLSGDETALRLVDGNNNSYEIDPASRRVAYVPITAEQSSSGTYSGGEPWVRELDAPRFAALLGAINAIYAQVDPCRERRMGSPMIVCLRDGLESSFVVPAGNRAFSELVAGLAAGGVA